MAKTITMTEKEITRLAIINKAIERSITVGQAAVQIGLSIRQAKRLKRKVADKKAEGVAHGLRGMPSNNQVPKAVLCQEKVSGTFSE